MRRLRYLGALLAFGLLLSSGCGTSSAPTNSREARITPQSMGAEAGTIASPAGGSTALHGDVRLGDGIVRQAHTAPSAGSDDQSSVAPTLDPCTLVRRSDLQAAAHANLASATVAPLGPTCIYRLSGARSEITLAVEPGRLATAARSLKRPRQLNVAGHNAYCGMLGQPRLLVFVSARRILDVSAPCSIAVPLARSALTRLSPRA
jgi:hypothetical protein